jgi:2-polyprenyl-3-methyl-5-hydroxy-6-metoxy-1,4-benzoquinol methylase/acyl carrier protein
VAHVVLNNDRQFDQREQVQHLTSWRSIWDDIYRQDMLPKDPRFNAVGWNSSYTGEPIPKNEMREWANAIAERILALNPRDVLEIGCGTGLILFQVAPKCSSYCATDTSQQALRYLEDQFRPGEFDNVTLIHRSADDLSGLGTGKFDVIVLNSVVQYFPDIDYLVRVLRSAADLVRPNGAIFLGDIRSLSLLRLLQAELQISNAPSETTLADLQRTIDQKIVLEKELVIDPAFFRVLPQLLPGIGRVEIQLKRGRHKNELTKFRYDVVLHVGDRQTPKADARTLRWDTNLSTIEDLRHLLHTSKPELLTIKDVANIRLGSSFDAMELLAAKPSSMTVGALRNLTSRLSGNRGLEPEDFWALEREFPYTVEVTWSESGSQETFDVVLIRHGVAFEPQPSQVTGRREPNWKRFANSPVYSGPARDLLPMMRNFLAERLPEHMIPWMIMESKQLLLTPNGKIDRAALSRLSLSKNRFATTPFVPPTTPVEVSLANIWKEVLRIERVGTQDNFFHLGGHSLLATQVVSRVRERLGINLPLRRMFESPTVAQLAKEILKSGQQSHTAEELPIPRFTSTAGTLQPEDVDQLTGDEIDSLLYQVLTQANHKL